MTVVGVILILCIAVAIIGAVAYALRTAGSAAEPVSDSVPGIAPSRPEPLVTDFHVRGDTASVTFAVPLGDSEAGSHLTELLDATAVEYIRRKNADGLPLDGVARIAVSAMRGVQPELIDTVELPDSGQLPERAEILSRDPSTHDPIAAVQSVAADATVAAQPKQTDSLKPIAELIELSSPTEAHLRSIGVDTSSMSLEDLVLGLLRVSGYEVEVGRPGFGMSDVDTGDIYWLSRSGTSALLVILRHTPGSYPELDDNVLAEFAVGVAQLNPSQAILVTEKFSPYSMYDRERRDKRLVFVTRERLQAFVDSFGLQ